MSIQTQCTTIKSQKPHTNLDFFFFFFGGNHTNLDSFSYMTCLDNKMSFPETWTTALKMHKQKVYVKVVSPY